MKLADDDTHRALAFLVSLDREGHQPTCDELNLFVDEGRRRTPTPTSLTRMTAIFSHSMSGLFDGETEKISELLLRIQWAADVDERMYLTHLGKAIFKALERESIDPSESLDVVLDPDDPIVLARCIAQIAKMGPSMLIDPYFRMESLSLILTRTRVNRILISDKLSKTDRGNLAMAVGVVDPDRDIEARVARSGIHDRHVIASDGKAAMLGSSLNGVGRSLSVFVELGEVSATIGKHYEAIWEASEILTAPDGAN